MKKKTIILCLCCLVVLLAGFLAYANAKGVFPFHTLNQETEVAIGRPDIGINWEQVPEDQRADFTQTIENAIYNKEMAIKMGRVILEEYFPEYFKDKVELGATETNGVWEVHTVIKNDRKNWKGEIVHVYGGGVYVKFRKNGEIIRIGVND